MFEMIGFKCLSHQKCSLTRKKMKFKEALAVAKRCEEERNLAEEEKKSKR